MNWEHFKDERKEKEAQRMEFAKTELAKHSKEIIEENETTLIISHNGQRIKFFPYTGYFNGKGIAGGRGIKKLIEQIK